MVVLAPIGTSSRTAAGMNFHSHFRFLRDFKRACASAPREAATLLARGRFHPMKQRLVKVCALRLDEVSIVGADKLSIMYELLSQERGAC